MADQDKLMARFGDPEWWWCPWFGGDQDKLMARFGDPEWWWCPWFGGDQDKLMARFGDPEWWWCPWFGGDQDKLMARFGDPEWWWCPWFGGDQDKLMARFGDPEWWWYPWLGGDQDKLMARFGDPEWWMNMDFVHYLSGAIDGEVSGGWYPWLIKSYFTVYEQLIESLESQSGAWDNKVRTNPWWLETLSCDGFITSVLSQAAQNKLWLESWWWFTDKRMHTLKNNFKLKFKVIVPFSKGTYHLIIHYHLFNIYIAFMLTAMWSL